MKLLKNKKGFTLVELLVAISIMGIIMVIALPQISNIQQNNQKTKYKKYAESMLTSAKLYTDSYTEDMFGNNKSGCIDVPYADMKDKDLLKDIKVDGSTCSSEDTFVRVRKSNDHYFYDVSVYCKDKNGKVVYDERLVKGVCDGSGPDEEGPTIKITPNSKDWTKGTNEKVTIKIWDDYGMLENTKVRLSWTKDGAAYGTPTETDFKNKRYEGESETNALTDEIPLPQNETGIFILTVTPVDVRDSVGNYQTTAVVSGQYKLDNTAPTNPTVSLYKWSSNSTEPTATTNLSAYTINTWSAKKVYTVPSGSTDSHSKGVYYQYKTTGAQGAASNVKAGAKSITTEGTSTITWRACDKLGNCTSYTSNKTVKVDMTKPTTPTTGAIGTVSGSNPTGSIKTAASGSTDTLSGLKEYRYLVTNTSTTPTNKSLFTTSRNFTRSCGTSYYAWAIAIDNVGNMSDIKSLGNTADGKNAYENYGDCSAKCGWTGTKTSANTCALITEKSTIACNRFDCCSEVTYKTTSTCSTSCDPGTLKREAYSKFISTQRCSSKDDWNGGSCNNGACETPVNATKYAGCDSYYISTCTNTTCKYTKKNGAADSGTIAAASLADQIGSNCNITYCSAWITGRSGTTVSFGVSNMAKCALTNVYAEGCSKSGVGTYSFNAGYSGISVSGSCAFQVTYAGPLARPDNGTTTSWRTYRCASDWYCTTRCGSSACVGVKPADWEG